MSSQHIISLNNELQHISLDIRSEKVASRNKGMTKLETILNGQKADLIQFLKSGASAREVWSDLFRCSVESIFKHASKMEDSGNSKSFQTLQNKNSSFAAAVNKIVSYAVEAKVYIPCSVIIESLFSIFHIGCIIQSFGHMFFQVVQDGILDCREVLYDMKLEDFKRVIAYCFRFYGKYGKTLSFAAIHCANKVIEKAIECAELISEIHLHLKDLKIVCLDELDQRAQAEAIKLTFQFVNYLCIDYHSSVRDFLREVLPKLCTYYHFRMREDAKDTFFNLCCVTIRIHNSDEKMDPENQKEWNKILRVMFSIVEAEIKEKNNQLRADNDYMSESLISFASKISYIIFWTQESENSDVQRKKMLKKSDKLQGILDLVCSSNDQINFRWLVVLSAVITENHQSITIIDVQPLLQAVVHAIEAASLPEHITAIMLCCEVILLKEPYFKISEVMNTSFYNKLWQTIKDILLRDGSNKSEIYNEKQCLIRLLIFHKKIYSTEVTSTFLKYLISTQSLKSDATLETIIVILRLQRSFVSDEILEQILHWLFPKTTSLDTRLLLSNNKGLKSCLVAELCASIVLDGVIADERENLSSSVCLTSRVKPDPVEMHLKYKYLKRPIFLDILANDEVVNPLSKPLRVEKTITANAVVVKESRFQTFLQLLNFEALLNYADNNDVTELVNTLDKLEILLSITDKLLSYDGMEMEHPQINLITKRLGLVIHHVGNCLESIRTDNVELNILSGILLKLECIFTYRFDMRIRNFIKELELNKYIEFVSAFSRNNDNRISDVDVDELKFREKLIFKSLTHLAHLEENDQAFECVQSFDFDLDNSDHLHCVFDLIGIFCEQSPYRNVADWVMAHVKELCQYYHKYVDVSTELITILPKIINYVKYFDDLMDNVCVILSSFIKKCFKRNYSPSFVRKTLLVVRNLAQICPMSFHMDNFEQLYFHLAKFLKLPSLSVRFAAVECIGHIINEDLITRPNITPSGHFSFSDELFSKIEYEQIGEEISYEDEKYNIIAISIQNVLTMFGSSFSLRRKAFIKLAELCYKYEMESAVIQLILEQLSSFFGGTSKIIFECHIESLFLYWLKENYPLQNLPWYLTEKTEKDFFINNIDNLSFATLRNSPKVFMDLPKLLKLNVDPNSRIEAIFPRIYGLCLPFIKEWNIPATHDYKKEATNLLKFNVSSKIDITKSISTVDTWRTLHWLASCIWDKDIFAEFFGFNFYFYKNAFLIDVEIFKKCLIHLMEVKYGRQSKNFEVLLKNEPKQMARLLSEMKQSIQKSRCIEQKFLLFFRFCCVIQLLMESLNYDFSTGSYSNTRKFFVRDALFYFKNILENPNMELSLKKATLEFLKLLYNQFLGQHSDVVSLCLRPLIRCMISLILNGELKEIVQSAIGILNFLIIENAKNLEADIFLLDDFPPNSIFDSLRTEHERIKRAKSDSNELEDDIKTFLQVADRGAEGLKSLRQNISWKKCELVQICNQNSSNGDVLLHSLTKYLLERVKSNDQNISLEAAKCLGELGPIKSQSFVLSPSIDRNCYYMFKSVEESVQHFLIVVVEQLNIFIISPDSETMAASLDVCEAVFGNEQTALFTGILKKFPLFHLFTIGPNASKSSIKFCTGIEKQNFVSELQPLVNLKYEEWISQFTSNLCKNFNSTALLRICKVESVFCETILSSIVKILLATKDETCLRNLGELVTFYFNENQKCIERESATNKLEENIYTDKSVVRCFLNIAECIRVHNSHSERKVNIDFLKIAQASLYCEAVFLALLYVELWCLREEAMNGISKDQLKKNKNYQKIAFESYKIIGCTDAILGFLDPLSSRIEYLDIQNQWSTVLMELDANCSNSSVQSYSEQLNKNGFYSLSASISKQEQTDYETLWRLCRWDTVVQDTREQEVLKMGENLQTDCENVFQREHFKALKAVYSREELKVCRAIDSARKVAQDVLKVVSTECSQNVYKYLCWLQLLQQIEDFFEIKFAKNPNINSILNKWEKQDDLPYGSFKETEIFLAQKMTMFEFAGIRAGRKIKEFYNGQDVTATLLLKLVQECKRFENENLCIRNLAKLKARKLQDDQLMDSFLEDAELNFRIGNTVISQAVLHHIVTKKDFGHHSKKVDALRRYGEYLAETSSETFEIVHEKFLKASLTLLDKFSENRELILKNRPNDLNLKNFDQFYTKSRKNIYGTIAKYADREFMQVDSYVKSSDFETKEALAKKSRKDAANLRLSKSDPQDRDRTITLNILIKNACIDDADIKHTRSKHTEYLCLATESYMKFCILDNAIKTSAVYRIISLWFANKDNTQLAEIITSNLNSIPSYKFVPLLNQITARLSGSDDEFNSTVQKLLVRCGLEHPHHTLLSYLTLKNAYLDPGSKDSSDERSKTAQKLIKIIKDNPACTNIVNQMETMCKVLVEYAYEKLPKNPMPLNDKMRKLKNLEYVHCPTLELDISITGEYHITHIKKWVDKVKLVGGINAPKKLCCLCSDGVERPQLLKGQDDLRQDAVMQQMLSIVNDFLKADKDTADRKLSCRTYKVTPLSKRSGILHWCEGTTPVGLYLSGENRLSGAHKKYRPKDYTAAKCRALMMECFQKPPKVRYETFLGICKNIKPVFHNFFFDTFLCPGVWFEKRLAYTNSVATMSIVGYILGLGDRHLQNILLDEQSGELIHIDFGIAFEQGKVMPTPEKVPFRLSRDIVAPMGICECEGVFRKSCEKTMKVLRENQLAIITILEVLLYDPLYAWTINSKKIRKSQKIELHDNEGNGASEEKNATAHRALMRVKNKLNGMDEDTTCVISIEAQVQRLIRQATNDCNLALLFPGWDPYL